MVSADRDPRRVGTIWSADLGEPRPQITPVIPTVFQRVGLESLNELSAAMGPGTIDEIRQRFTRGRACWAAWVEGVISAYGWASFNEETIGELNLRLDLPPGEVYIWDCATLPVFRRQGLYSALLSAMLDQLAADGVNRAWIGANLDNEPSQRGIDRTGFRRVADLVIARSAHKRMVWAQAYPGVPESLVGEARRAFLGQPR